MTDTHMEVAKEVGISQAQVSRLEKNDISRIKKGYQRVKKPVGEMFTGYIIDYSF